MSPQYEPGAGHSVMHDGLSVVGTGRAMASVDTVTVTMAAQVTHADAGEAFRGASNAVTAVLGVLADHGVDSRSVQTQHLSLGPEYDSETGVQAPVGYRAEQQLLVTLEGLAGIEDMLTAIVRRIGPALRIRNVQLAAANPREAESAARTAAMIDAREKATSLATLAGRSLGRIVDIVEAPDAAAAPIALMAHDWGTASRMPIASGDTAVTVAVRVRFAWAD